MKTYSYVSDAYMGTVEAESIDEALVAASKEIQLTDKHIKDGAFLWVRDPETLEKRSIAPENEF